MFLTVHASGGPSFGQLASSPVSLEISSRFGPRDCGQSKGLAVEAPWFCAVAVIVMSKTAREQKQTVQRFCMKLTPIGKPALRLVGRQRSREVRTPPLYRRGR